MAIDLSALDPREALTAIYIGYYDRAPDPEGLAFWEDVVGADGFNLVSITTLFASASETQALFPFFADPDSTTASAFITQLYQNLFNRDPDAEGLAFWTAQLEAAVAGEEGALTVGQIITSIIEGAQSVEEGGFPDETIILNKIEVGLDWTDSINAAGIEFDLEGDTGASARAIIDGVDETDASVVTARSTTDTFVAENTPGVPGSTFILEETRDGGGQGTEGNDTFEAFNGELQDGDRVDGGSGTDMLWYFNSEDGPAKAPITTSIEHVVVTNQVNDLNSSADNNVGGYSTNFGDVLAGAAPLDGTIEVDVELDAGLMNGVTRWEDYDSRADLVIEDARDQDDTDGTFTGDITVAMVSTDPGNVDFAVYFDQPVNVSQNFGTLELRVLDQEAAFGLPAPSASSTGYLTESSLIEFTFAFNGQEITVELADELGVTFGPDVSFQDLLDQIEGATQQALVDAGVTEDLGFAASLGAPVSVGVGNQFTLPMILTFDVEADTITASSDDIIVTGRDSGNNGDTPATDTFGSLSTARETTEELIRLNVELDDVGKGSTGGDALFGAMSTGRQTGDDGTSDSIGIQQFDIEVDRSSQLQTINSTNNALEVVNIAHGENDGASNTTTAADEIAGDLVVRGQASPIDQTGGTVGNPFGNSATDGPMPGAVPQHNSFGFSDVRVINAAGMTGVQADGSVGYVDITAELTEEIVEKYLDIQDGQANGEDDDVDFIYTLGAGNDEFLLQMSADALNSAGTGSREDFDLIVDGGAGNDVITTNIGGTDTTEFGFFAQAGAIKTIDEQGQDHYLLTSDNAEGWYTNAVSNVAAEFSVNGGAGADTIWTHGWGDFNIDAGTGADVVYTDNSGAVEAADRLASNIDRNLDEHDQIDYVVGGVWAFNAELVSAFPLGVTGATNDTIALATLAVPAAAVTGSVTYTISYAGASGVAGTEYVITATIPFSEMTVDATTGLVSHSEQALNQAIKNAINEDAILSNLLEAADGPGNSLIVATKTDGTHVATDLAIALGTVDVNNGAAFTAAPAFPVANTGYSAPEFVNLGSDSVAESDNTITVNGDGANDLYVLSTNDAAFAQPVVDGGLDALTDLNSASNEVLNINANFGIDTVLNFDAGAGDGVDMADDVLDFTAVTGVAANVMTTFDGTGTDVTAASADGSVDILALATVDGADGSTANGTVEAAEILALAGAGDAVASNHIYIVHDTTGDNGGEVWHVVDGTAATGDVSATEIGTINLVGTDWLAVNTDNIA
ncbi:MAG: DUF4214 domain-containing protein [Sulfitobacter sp.]